MKDCLDILVIDDDEVDSDQEEIQIPEDPELLKLFTGVANLPKDKKDALMRVMEIVVREHRIQSAIAS